MTEDNYWEQMELREKCANCEHTNVFHWAREHGCLIINCECKQFKTSYAMDAEEATFREMVEEAKR